MNGDSQLMAELQQTAARKVPKEDYQQQVDRWNEYQALLDKVQHRCDIENFPFFKNLKTSYSDRRKRNATMVVSMLFFACSAMAFNDAFSLYPDINKTYYLHGAQWTTIFESLRMDLFPLIGLPFVIAWSRDRNSMFNFGKLPENIKFSCTPKMFIDDLYFVRRFVHGMSKEQNDPEVKLPELTMELPQWWIKQQSLVKAMDGFK